MILMLLALQAIGIAEPTPEREFMVNTMPRLRGGEITMSFFVDSEGMVLECEVLSTWVSEERAAEYCEDTIGETLGEPATDPDGQPTHGTITLSVVRTSSTNASPRIPPQANVRSPDLEILVAEMPGGKEREAIGLTVYIDEDGRVQRCRQLPNEDFDFSNVACSQATAHIFEVRRGADGRPVGHVDTISVDFVLEQPST